MKPNTYILKQTPRGLQTNPNWVEYFELDLDNETAYGLGAKNTTLIKNYNYWFDVFKRLPRPDDRISYFGIEYSVLTKSELFLELL